MRKRAGHTRLFAGVLLMAMVKSASAAAPAGEAPDGGFMEAARHEHGAATLAIALDGSTISVRFSSPAHELLGFERAPRTGAETARAEAIRALLANGERVVRWPVAAGCRQTRVAVTSPEWAATASGAPVHADGHVHDEHPAEGRHADYDADYEFSCSAPSRLAYLDAPIRRELPAATRLEVTILTDRQQTQRELAIGQTRIDLR